MKRQGFLSKLAKEIEMDLNNIKIQQQKRLRRFSRFAQKPTRHPVRDNPRLASPLLLNFWRKNDTKGICN